MEAASLNASIGTMYLDYKDEFLPFFKQNHTFASGISDVKLEVDFNRGYTILKEFSFLKISHLHLRHARFFWAISYPWRCEANGIKF